MDQQRRDFLKAGAGSIAALAIADTVLAQPTPAAWPGVDITQTWAALLGPEWTNGTKPGLNKWSSNLMHATFEDMLYHHGFNSPNPDGGCEGRVNKLTKADFDDLAQACAKKFSWNYPKSRTPGSCSCTT